MKEIYTIGRDESCDIVVPDSTNIISRLHATVRIDSRNRIFITDKSCNGTYVNGMKMSSNVEIPVSRKDVVSFAHIYNLDWSLIPKRRNNILIGAILVLALVVAVTVLVLVFTKSTSEPAPLPDPVPPTPIIPISTDTEESFDSVPDNDEPKQGTETKEPVQSDPAPRVAPETKPVLAPKDSVPKSDPKESEEIYHPNPLY